MIRPILAALLLAVAGLATTATAGTTTLSGRMPGSGRCLLTSPEAFLCTFNGTFTGRLDGVRRTGEWRLTFSVRETANGYELKRPAGTFRLGVPATANKPRVVVTAADGALDGILAREAAGSFDLWLPLTPPQGDLVYTAAGTFGPGNGALTVETRLPARFTLGYAPDGGASGSPHEVGLGTLAPNPGHGATVFTGSGSGRGECAVMSTDLTVCSWRGTFAGKLLGIDREGRFALQVSLHRSAPSGVEPPPYNPKEIGIDAIVLRFSRTDTKPGRLIEVGPGGAGTVAMTPEGAMAFTSVTKPFADGLVLEIVAEARWGVEGLKATGNEVAIESLEIVHEG